MKTNINFKKIIIGITCAILPAIIFGAVMLVYGEFKDSSPIAQEQVKDQAEERKKSLIDDFTKDKNLAINELNDILKYGNPSDAQLLAIEYINALNSTKYKDDSDLLAFIEQSKVTIIQKAKEDKTSALLAKLNKSDPNGHSDIRDIYKELAELNPDNNEYSKKNEHYKQLADIQKANKIIENRRIEVAKNKKIKADERKKQIKSQFAADGSNWIFVYQYQKQLHDPDSFEHIETRYEVRGEYIYVEMRYRAKNLLGAKRISMKSARISIDGERMKYLN